MKRTANDSVTSLRLPAIDGSVFELDSLKNSRYMLSFFRFASCPFCNLCIHELVSRFNELGGDFTVVAVFDSSLNNLQRHAGRHRAPFPILADEDNTYYRSYGIEHSMAGMLKGMLFRMLALIKGMFFKGYMPLVIKGNITTMPADLLVDESGIIQKAHYGKDEGDHLPFDEVKLFSLRN